MKKFLTFAAVLILATACTQKISNQKSIDTSNANTAPVVKQVQPEVTKPQGLGMKTVKEGTGVAAQNGDTVYVHYTGTLTNGTKFDSSRDRGTPFSFILGAGRVIKGWDLGVLGMKVGEQRSLTIAPELGYGSDGVGSIPPNATLLFDVELLSINSRP